MVIDLDDFRTVNDRYGHRVGDDTLKAVARALTRRLRETDLVARLGGDEFAVLLPHIDKQGLSTVVGSLSRAVPEWSIDVGEAILHCSASVGSPSSIRAPKAPSRRSLTPIARCSGQADQGGRIAARHAPLTPPDRPCAGAREPRRALRRGQYAQAMQPDERLAVIDLGSNSFRLVVFMAHDGWWKRTDEIYEPVRIGEGLAASGRLGERPIERALATLDVFAHFCRASGLGADAVDAVATSAIRDAENADSFLASARERTGLPIRVLSREQEARYGYIAAVNSTTLSDGYVLDLGGGSMQLVHVAGRLAREFGSWPRRDGADDRALPAGERPGQAQADRGAPRPRRLRARAGDVAVGLEPLTAARGVWSASAGPCATSRRPPSGRRGCPPTACRGW